MTEVDVLPTNEWPSLLEQLNITQPVNELQSSDLLGKGFPTLEKWEVFYKTYSKWIGFSIRVDDVKRRGELITMRRWVCSKEGFRRDEHVNNPDHKKDQSQSQGQAAKLPSELFSLQILVNS